MVIKDIFAGAKKVRVQLTQAQMRSIAQMYSDVAAEIKKEQANLANKTNVSAALRASYLNDLGKQIDKELEHVGVLLNTTVRANMTAVAKAVVADNASFLSSIGLRAGAAYSYVPRDVVETIASGKLYEGKWTLSKGIWGTVSKGKSDVDMIVAKGVASQKSALDIAKDLEKYVSPSAKKPWDWNKVYPGSAVKIDYNAQRLARTMVSHAYQESFVQTTQDNPFIDAYQWLSSGDERVCQICTERVEDFHGVVINGEQINGAFWKDELPIDHPNGRCAFDIVTSDDLRGIAKRIAQWTPGSDPQIDAYAKRLGYDSED